MKNWNTILSVALLLSVYCFGIYIPASTLPSSYNLENTNKKEQKEILSTSSKILYAHTQQFESLYSDVTENTFPAFKVPFNVFWNTIYTNKILFNSKFKQYDNHLKTLLIRQRKSDLIFPFHYFW